MKKEKKIFFLAIVLLGLLTGLLNSCQEESNDPQKQLPQLTTTSASVITNNSATSGGVVSDDGGEAVTDRGVCWSTNQNPTITDSKAPSGSGTGTFVSTLTSLTASTTYHVRAYATNKVGTAYGEDVSFTTSATAVSTVPTLTTKSVSGITQTSATSGGEITNDGGSAVTVRGICWSTTHDPTISNNKTNDGTGAGSFTSSLTPLVASTTYYVRAYATNAIGTAYGSEISFTTAAPQGTGNTMTDADGNTYKTVTLGTQVWSAENLKTTKYNDGTPITNITGDADWINATSGAYGWYNNDAPTFKNVYGALYNWYAVNTNKLCPVNWHVPTDDEWTTLENYLIASGYNYDGTTNGDRSTNNKLAKSLADLTTWDAASDAGSPGNTDFPAKRNATGFTGLAGGFRNFYGQFSNEGVEGWWYSASEIVPGGSTTVWSREIYTGIVSVSRGHYEKYYALSVRCVKD